MNDAIEPRPEVMAFARAMERQLRKHDGDRTNSWRTTPQDVLEYEAFLHYQTFVRRAFNLADGDTLLGAADVGNFLWMICDNKGVLK